MPEERNLTTLSLQQVKLLESVADLAVSYAAEAAAHLLGMNMQIRAIQAHGMPARSVSDTISDPEALTAAIYMKVDGSAPGHAAFVCTEEEAYHLADLLLGKPPGTTQYLDELAESALKELGNILTSSYLTSLSEHTELTFLPHPPQLAIDMAYTLISAILVGSVEASAEAISVVTEFSHDVGPLQGHFLYIPDRVALPVLLAGLKEAA